MSDERPAGEGLQVPEGSKIAVCPDCGELLFVATITGGKEVLVQPIVVRGLIPDVELIQTKQQPAPEELIQKVVSRTATARFSPPLLIPHHLVCIRAPLIRTLPSPTRLVPQGPEPRPPEKEPETKVVEMAPQTKDPNDPNLN